MSNFNTNSNLNTNSFNTPSPVVHTDLVMQQQQQVLVPVPVAGMAQLNVNEQVRHEPERVITHEPIVEKQIVNERPLEVRREHHIQPVIHETEHRIQPIIKTEATAEQTYYEKDRNVMLPAIQERAALPAGLAAVDRQTSEGILHKPLVERQVINERPVEVRREHHVQPIIHEREHRIQPIIKTQATAEQTHTTTDRNVMLAPIIERAALPAGLEAVERATGEGIIHQARFAKDVVVEHPVIVKHEHHVQPIIHEREHQIQPIIKTEVTSQQTHLRTDRNVVLEPIVERAALPVGLEAVERATNDGILHRAKFEREVIVEHPVQVNHERHIQPVIHEHIHEIQPIIQTQVTAEQRVINQEHTVQLPPIIEPTVFVNQQQPLMMQQQPRMLQQGAIPVVMAQPMMAERGMASSLGASTGQTATHVGIGQKIKGTVKEASGKMSHNPAKVEEGRAIKHGQPTTSTMGGAGRMY